MTAILELPDLELAPEVETAEARVPEVETAEVAVAVPKVYPLLLEIGCEEIPARFLADAQKQFGERLHAALDQARLLPTADAGPGSQAPLQTYSTPRRLAAHVPRVLAVQPDQSEDVMGPPVKIAFDAAGRPTRAAESFAQKNGVRVEDLLKISTPKGEYLQAKKLTPGRQALVVLQEILPGVITGLAFPKSMYWEPSKTRFVRPIRWIVALLGEGNEARVVPFEVAGVASGNSTHGHRGLGTTPIQVMGFDDYAQILRQARVEFDPERRRVRVLDQIEVLLKFPGLSAMKGRVSVLRAGAGKTDPEERLEAVRSRIKAMPEEFGDLRLIADRDLEDWVVNSTECPYPILGTFEERFLKLPREILITVMRDHQKYFAVESSAGELKSCFVTVLNVPGDPKGTIRAGHERVLTARFSDAEFFWNADQKVPLRDRLPMLDRVTYQAELGSQGSYGVKVRRMEPIARHWCDLLRAQSRMTEIESAETLRAVALCKCDLTTQMVQEFTELQGIVGGLYATAQGEPQQVADAIYDHYRPAGIDDQLPRTLVGAVASLADKIDSLACGFAAGHAPTGSRDPFGLRRQGNGIVRILLESGISVPLKGMFERPVYAVTYDIGKPDHLVRPALESFLDERLRFYLETAKGLRYDTVRAVLAIPWNDPLDVLHRAEALEAIRGRDDFLALSSAAKRINNILTKSATASDWTGGEVDESLLQAGAEAGLYHTYRGVEQEAAASAQSKEYGKALQAIATLRPAVDLFFDKVLVMAEDRALRQNRLRLLGKLDVLFSRIAHFSEIEGNIDM
ncbi:MAG: glycine--tRNA ligase subunit beta [Terriglobia bacterium]